MTDDEFVGISVWVMKARDDRSFGGNGCSRLQM